MEIHSVLVVLLMTINEREDDKRRCTLYPLDADVVRQLRGC